MKKIKKVLFLLLFLALVISLLIFPKQSVSYALSALQLWYGKMIPTLLPFMILSSIMIHLDLHTSFMKLFTPLLAPIFRLSTQCLYVIFIGFLCGFPMGARTCVQLYNLGRITKVQAEYLLAFCNNIGPVYFISFVLLTLQTDKIIPYLLGMYGIPILYGIILRYTFYRTKLLACNIPASTSSKEAPAYHLIQPSKTLYAVMDDAIMGSLRQIAMLGGYMILFSILNMIPFLLQIKHPFWVGYTHCLLEITSGIMKILSINTLTPLLRYCIFTSVSFGGLCCLAQTFSVLKDSDLSIKSYVRNKLILWLISCVYFFFLIF